MVRLSKPGKNRAALLGVPLRLRAGATVLASFRVALVSSAALAQRFTQPVPLGHPVCWGRRAWRLCFTRVPRWTGVSGLWA